MKLDRTTLATLRLPPGKSEMFIWDDDLPGFGVRLRGASVRWIIQYRINAQQRRESLGDVRKVTLDAARKIARQRFAQAELGTDPVAEKAKARAAATAAKLTLEKAAESYLAAKAGVVRPSTHDQSRLHLTNHWRALADRPLDGIKRSDVATTLHQITQQHGRTAASRARGNLSALYGWAMREGLCEANPVVATNDPGAGIRPRERVLSDRELAVIWRACEDDDFGRIVRLLILTGCRREEIGGLKWSEIDLDAGTMTIPGERTKNHKTHSLTLPSIAMDILRSAPMRAGREFVFGYRGGSFSAWSYSMLAMNSRITAIEGQPLPRWVLHDLRRSMRTGVSGLGVQPHIAERTVNHIKGGVEAIYDRYRYEREITAALALWADHVISIVENRQGNVAASRRA
jgi:integrase